jgi:hypothetical protein
MPMTYTSARRNGTPGSLPLHEAQPVWLPHGCMTGEIQKPTHPLFAADGAASSMDPSFPVNQPASGRFLLRPSLCAVSFRAMLTRSALPFRRRVLRVSRCDGYSAADTPGRYAKEGELGKYKNSANDAITPSCACPFSGLTTFYGNYFQKATKRAG